jgi:hypothetical protein
MNNKRNQVRISGSPERLFAAACERLEVLGSKRTGLDVLLGIRARIYILLLPKIMSSDRPKIDNAPIETSLQELVASALNEQGYLLHHKVVSVLNAPPTERESCHDWKIEASEVPVSLPNGDETRIDLVLRHEGSSHRPWRVVMECKRSAKDYKHWVFFGTAPWQNGPSPRNYYVEKANLIGSWKGQGDPPMNHSVEARLASLECPVFDYGVEVRVNRATQNQRSSATNAIEDAFQQVTLGQAGLALRLRSAHELNFRLLPVVVTTGNLVSAQFGDDRVTLDEGKISAADLLLTQRQWLAVNYRMNDVACRHSGVTTNRTADLAAELVARQVRTVFVVQASYLQRFLAWLEKAFECHAG